MIGLARGTVKIVPFQAEWKNLFEREAVLLRRVIGKDALRIEHIGSTAIEGMCAKPIIDLVVAIENLADAKVWIAKLEELGYEFRPDNNPPDRLFFAKGEHICRTHHLSLTEPDSQFFREKLLFRDYLGKNTEAFDEYKNLKLNLAARFAGKRESYTDGKAAFIEKILSLAGI